MRSAKPHYLGHRQRTKEKLLEFGIENFQDYEAVELMLFLIFKRKDVKPLAKELIKRFQTIDKILDASIPDLLQIKGIGKNAAESIKIMRGVVLATLKSKAIKYTSINCLNDVIDYCKIDMKNLVMEELRVLFLNAINEIIADEILQKGDVDSVGVYPRMIAKRCIEVGAKGIILVHNHPSGDPTPSQDDVFMTKLIREALNVFEIKIHDHIIIGRDKFISLKNLALL